MNTHVDSRERLASGSIKPQIFVRAYLRRKCPTFQMMATIRFTTTRYWFASLNRKSAKKLNVSIALQEEKKLDDLLCNYYPTASSFSNCSTNLHVI